MRHWQSVVLQAARLNTYNSIQGVGILAGLDDSCPAREALQLDLIHIEREEGSGRRRKKGRRERKE